MNIEKVSQFRDHLVRTKHRRTAEGFYGFNMGHFLSRSLSDRSVPAAEDTRYCGTTACLGGHAVLMTGMPFAAANRINAEKEAAQILGLTRDEMAHMFYGDWGSRGGDAWGASIDDAIAYLNKVIDEKNVFVTVPITGVVTL